MDVSPGIGAKKARFETTWNMTSSQEHIVEVWVLLLGCSGKKSKYPILIDASIEDLGEVSLTVYMKHWPDLSHYCLLAYFC